MNNETYTTKIKDDIQFDNLQSYLNCPGMDIDTNRRKATIFWSLEPEAREYGIKWISRTVSRIQFESEWDYPTDELTSSERELLTAAGGQETMNDTIEGTIQVDTIRPINGKEWSFIVDFHFAEDGAISPSSISIDFLLMVITIS